ncbi:hypothetical protein D3C72_1913630 [compost metagenome]
MVTQLEHIAQGDLHGVVAGAGKVYDLDRTQAPYHRRQVQDLIGAEQVQSIYAAVAVDPVDLAQYADIINGEDIVTA